MSMSNTEKKVKDIRRNTRRKFSTEEKIRIVLEGLRGESSVAELCRREGINPNLYYRWSKDFLEAGRTRLSGDTVRDPHTDEVTGLKRENGDLKQAVAELYEGNYGRSKRRPSKGVVLDDEGCAPTRKSGTSSVWTRNPNCRCAGVRMGSS